MERSLTESLNIATISIDIMTVMRAGNHNFDISPIVDTLCNKDSYLPVYHGVNFHRRG